MSTKYEKVFKKKPIPDYSLNFQKSLFSTAFIIIYLLMYGNNVNAVRNFFNMYLRKFQFFFFFSIHIQNRRSI